ERLDGGSRFGNDQCVGLVAIELPGPGLARVARMKNHTAMTYGPAIGGVRKMHSRQQDVNRDFTLLPCLPTIVRVDDMPTLTHGNEAITGAGHVDEQRGCDQVTLNSGFRNRIGRNGCIEYSAGKYRRQ